MRQGGLAGGMHAAERDYEYEGTSADPAILFPSSPTLHYVRGPDMGGGVGGLLYSLRDESSTLKVGYNLSNGRGDIVAQSDEEAEITWTASYEAYGKRPVETVENLDKQRANSKDEDPTGLLNEGFRYRDIETGMWLSRDPAGFVDSPNLYAYVKQNPWTSWDPEGLMCYALPSQYAQSAEFRQGFNQGMAEGAKVGLAMTAGVVATVVAAPVIAAGAATVGLSGNAATAVTVLGSGAAGGYASHATSNVLNGHPVNQNWEKAVLAGALLNGTGHVVGKSVTAFKEGFNSVKSPASSVGGASAQVTSKVASTLVEVEAPTVSATFSVGDRLFAM